MEETRKPSRKPRAPAVKKPAAQPAAKPAAKSAASKSAAASAKPPVRKPAAASPPAKAALAPREDLVRIAAYFRAERRGFAPGQEWEDWLAAEAEVAAPGETGPAAKSRKKGPAKPSAL